MSSCSWLGKSVPRCLPIAMPKRYIAISWQVKVFVAATPISGPARVYSTASTSRVMLLPTTLVTASVRQPRRRASRAACKVSALSPLCEMSTMSG